MLLLRLRQETRALHARAEHAVDLGDRLSSRGTYANLMLRMLGFYAPLERALERIDWPTVGLDFASRTKVPALRDDLRALGIHRDVVDASARCATLPSLHAPAHALGCLYVLEGATLGGMIVSRMLAVKLDIGAHDGGAFYASYGTDIEVMWRAFGDVAARYCHSEERRAAAVQTAVRTFECFIAWLSQEGQRFRGRTVADVDSLVPSREDAWG